MGSRFETIGMIGMGYIGLPTATVLASYGLRVVGVDIDQTVVDTINRGQIHIVEPDLEGLVQKVVGSGLLTAKTSPEPSHAFVIAVPTPFQSDRKPDLTYVEAAAKSIAPVLSPGNLVILESTSPVGTTEKLCEWLARSRPDLSFPPQAGEDAQVQVAYCPERVLPGHVLRELVENDRVIGGMTRRAAELAADLYRIFVRGECFLTDCRTAEMVKLTENAFRDVNIAFANELSLVCDHLRIDVWELIRLANRHPRVNILQPGPGVGGHCIAVDPWFIVDSAPEQARLIRTAREVNDHKPHHVVEQIKNLADKMSQPVIACLGLSFKANINDLRESPALEIVRMLGESRIGRVLAVEPHISACPPSLQGDVELTSIDSALAAADIVVILVDHAQFKGIDWTRYHDKKFVDTRGMIRSR